MVSEVVGEEQGVPLGIALDQVVADEKAHQLGADDLEKISDGDVGDAGQAVEYGLGVVATRASRAAGTRVRSRPGPARHANSSCWYERCQFKRRHTGAEPANPAVGFLVDAVAE